MNRGDAHLRAPSQPNTELSVVIPVWNEAENLPALASEMVPVLASLGNQWEVIFVDDGSTDGTWKTIATLHESESRIRGVRLSRNFGHQYALFAGLFQAEGRAVITMDGDLQHPPSVILRLVEGWKAGSKIVHTIRVDDESLPLLKRMTSKLFYRLFALLSGVEISEGIADFRLLDRQVVDNLLRFREEGVFLRGLVHWIGFSSVKVAYQARPRHMGVTKYSFRKMYRLAWHGVTSFSVVPLRFAVLVGIIVSLLAFGETAYAIYTKVVAGQAVPGWASTVSVISFLFGILFILLGIIGEYIGRILAEVRARPRFLISESVGLDGPWREDVTVLGDAWWAGKC